MRIPFPINYPEMVVEKSDGLTTSERKLAILGNHTFLRLWSYPNPYKMQLEGKELCDLLIVFDNHIIIFSDKDCKYGKSGNSLVDWRRWYKRAIQKSAEQLIGARNWILRHPDRIAIDAKCSKRLPLEIKITPQTKFHLVAIAHGTEEPCKAYFSGGDGGLLIDNRIVGDMHINEKCEPFSIGQVFSNPEDFIHVFDDSSYINVLTELDTAVRFWTVKKPFPLTTAAQNIHVLFRKLPLCRSHFFEWLKAANFSTACETATLKSPPSRGSDAPRVHPRPRRRISRCTLDCGFKTPESPALRGFVGGPQALATAVLYLVLLSNGFPYSKIRLKKFDFSPIDTPANIAKKLPSQRCSQPFLIAFSTSRTNGPHSLSQMKAGTHSAFGERLHTTAYTPKQEPSLPGHSRALRCQ